MPEPPELPGSEIDVGAHSCAPLRVYQLTSLAIDNSFGWEAFGTEIPPTPLSQRGVGGISVASVKSIMQRSVTAALRPTTTTVQLDPPMTVCYSASRRPPGRPGDRRPAPAGGRKVRAPLDRVLGNSQASAAASISSGDAVGDGKWHRNIPPRPSRGKGEIGRQERPVRGGNAATAKPHLEQGQIGEQWASGPLPGWPLDPNGNVAVPALSGRSRRPPLVWVTGRAR